MNYAEKKLKRVSNLETVKKQSEEILNDIKKELVKMEKINAIVLFGSFARGDYSERHSDLDIMIFLDDTEKNTALEERILKKIIQINQSKRISIHTVFQYKKLSEEDASLMLTIAEEGRTLFAKKSIVISKDILGLKSHHLVIFDTANTDQIKKNKLQRFLHGYSVKGKKYRGIIDGDKVIGAGKGAIIVPQELLNKVLLFADYIDVKARQGGKFYK
ncbi:nucleotidyltransferase domain-containing protein [Candidatus Woesearchaeota archaeon]|nr:nucleotidyltransferase domain-containing protein [Candidatus Woesearchaeota archaeon]